MIYQHWRDKALNKRTNDTESLCISKSSTGFNKCLNTCAIKDIEECFALGTDMQQCEIKSLHIQGISTLKADAIHP